MGCKRKIQRGLSISGEFGVMNDRFKFRFYNKQANKMVEPKNWQKVDGIFECLKQQVCFDEDIQPLPYDHISNGLVFMQCTGFKDINGKLIYEGDICKVVNGSINNIKIDHIQPIKWNGLKWNIPQWFYEDGFNSTHYIEVLGNLYETPDLLESEKL